MDDRMFPIQVGYSNSTAAPHPHKIPWSIAQLAYSVYARNYGGGQTLERLAERGGFGAGEMDEFLPDWRERCSEVTALRAQLTEANRRIEAAEKRLGDQKAIHSRWFDGNDQRDKSDILNDMEHVGYSARLYLSGETGPYRPDLVEAKPTTPPGEKGAGG